MLENLAFHITPKLIIRAGDYFEYNNQEDDQKGYIMGTQQPIPVKSVNIIGKIRKRKK